MKEIILLIIAIMAVGNLSAGERTRGSGKFKASDDDDQSFIQKQLIHEGFKNIITKKLTKMGLNQELFWEKYNEKLAEAHKKIEEELKLKYKIDEKPSAAQLRAYNKDLRRKKLLRERSLAGISNIIPRWVLIKISRSQKYPRNRYIQLEGEVDTNKLNKLYYRFIKGKQTSDYGNLYVRVQFDLNGFTYSDIGIENEKDFDDVIVKKWIEWFAINKPLNISSVLILDGEMENQLKSYMSSPSDEMLSNTPAEFENSLLMDLNIKIKNLESNKELNVHEFEFSGNGYLKNLQSNIVINTYKLVKEEKEYRLSKESSLANILANHVYRVAKDYFPNINRDIKNLTPISAMQKIQLQGFRSIKEMHSLLDLMQVRGVKYSLKTEVESVSQDFAEVIVYYDGEIDQIKTLLMGLQSAKKDLSFDLVDTSDGLGIKFKSETVGEKI